jgi:hypothetical protein
VDFRSSEANWLLLIRFALLDAVCREPGLKADCPNAVIGPLKKLPTAVTMAAFLSGATFSVLVLHSLPSPGLASVPDPAGPFNVVPNPFPVLLQVAEVAHLPRLTKDRIPGALDRILRLAPRLSAAEDQALIALAQELRDGRRQLRLTRREILRPQEGAQPLPGRMAFNCEGQELALNPKVETSGAFLALSLYHELAHGAQCLQGLDFVASEVEPCAFEAPAYAAQVRFLIALHQEQALPRQASASEPSDLDLFEQTLDAWRALAQGPKRFCAWYRTQSAGEDASPEPKLSALLGP